MTKPTPIRATCDTCKFLGKRMDPENEGHCYMFRKAPLGNWCAQYSADAQGTPRRILKRPPGQ